MTTSKTKPDGKPPKFVLTPEQREIAKQIQSHAEHEKPEILAEGRRVKAAALAMSGHLQGAMALLKSLRKSDGVTLDEVASRTGIQKASLSRLESDAAPNVTLNTLYRIADALGYDLHVSVTRRPTKAAKPTTRRARMPS